jgi:hypothetical protein
MLAVRLKEATDLGLFFCAAAISIPSSLSG